MRTLSDLQEAMSEYDDAFLDETPPSTHTHTHRHRGSSDRLWVTHRHEHTHRRMEKRRYWMLHDLNSHPHRHREKGSSHVIG